MPHWIPQNLHHTYTFSCQLLRVSAGLCHHQVDLTTTYMEKNNKMGTSTCTSGKICFQYDGRNL